MGRLPKPTNLKLLQGNPGKRPLNEREPKASDGVPKPPDCLSDEALKEWKRLSPELEKNKILTHFDRAAFASYCMAWGFMEQAYRGIQARRNKKGGGLLTESADGTWKVHPHVQVFNKQLENTLKAACHFGFTPATRSKISGDGGPGQLDEMEALLSGLA